MLRALCYIIPSNPLLPNNNAAQLEPVIYKNYGTKRSVATHSFSISPTTLYILEIYKLEKPRANARGHYVLNDDHKLAYN
jgi:hypothetical protein